MQENTGSRMNTITRCAHDEQRHRGRHAPLPTCCTGWRGAGLSPTAGQCARQKQSRTTALPTKGNGTVCVCHLPWCCRCSCLWRLPPIFSDLAPSGVLVRSQIRRLHADACTRPVMLRRKRGPRRLCPRVATLQNLSCTRAQVGCSLLLCPFIMNLPPATTAKPQERSDTRWCAVQR